MLFSASLSRSLAWQWVQAALLALNLAWTTLCLGGYRPETMVVTSSLTAALLAVHCAAAAVERARLQIHFAGWLLLPFLGYALLNVLFVTPVGWLGWIDWFGWAQMIAVFWVVVNGVRDPRPRRFLFLVLVALAVVAVALAAFQRFVQPDWLMLGRVQADQFIGRSSGPFGIPNSLAAFLLLLLPTSAALAWRRTEPTRVRLAWAAVAVVLLCGVVLSVSRGAWIALSLALIAWPLFAREARWTRRFGLAVGALGAVATLSTVVYFASPVVRDRVAAFIRDAGERSRPIMWRGAWRLFREHPVVGSGGGSYNVLFEKYRPEGFTNEPQWAHNDYLNTLSDYGAVGFVLFFGAVAAIGWWRLRRPAGLESTPAGVAAPPALGVGLLAFAFQLFVDFHFKISALAIACGTLAALALNEPDAGESDQPDRPRRRRSRFRIAPAIVGTLLVCGVVGWILPLYRGEALRYRGRQIIDSLALDHPAPAEFQARLTRARALLEQAVALHPWNGQAWSDAAYARSLWGHVEPQNIPALGRQAEAAADAALGCSTEVFEFWIRRGVARDMQGKWVEAGSDFTRALTLASANAVPWFYQAEHQSYRPFGRELARASLEFCLRLDPQNPEALALRQRLAISAKAP